MKLRFFTFHFSFFICLAAMAQLDNTVEVTNEVKPVVTDVKKVDVKSKTAETQVKHYTMQYAVQGQPLTNYAPEPLGDYESEAVWKGNKRGYLHLSGGVLGNLDEQVAYQFDLTNHDALIADFSLKGFNGKAKSNGYCGVKNWKSRDYRNRAALKYNHRFDNGVDFFVKGDYENHLFNYMGGGASVTDKQHNVLGSAVMGFTPYTKEALTIGATVGVGFFGQEHLTNMQKKLGETTFHANADAAYAFTDEHSVELGVDFFSSTYRNDELNGITRFRFTPHYLYDTKKMALKLGMFVSTKGNVAPDAAFTYHINPRNDVYVEARGYEQNNDFRRLSSINPYFGLNGQIGDAIKLDAEFHKIDVCVGYRFKSAVGFSGNIDAGYDLSKNAPEMERISTTSDGRYFPWMELLVEDHCYYIDADFTYAYKDNVKVEARHRVEFSHNKEEDADWLEGSYVVPVFDMDWKADFKVMHGLYVGMDWRLACYKSPSVLVASGAAYERPNTVNLGASIRYTLPIDLPLTLFVKGDNLLNQNYDRYFGYRNIGASFLGGFSMSF